MVTDESVFIIQESYPNKIDIDIRLDDFDATGYLSSSSIASFYQEAFLKFISTIFLEKVSYRHVIISINIQYAEQCLSLKKAVIGLGVISISDDSYEVRMGMFDGANCLGQAAFIICLKDGGIPVAIPFAIKTKLVASLFEMAR